MTVRELMERVRWAISRTENVEEVLRVWSERPELVRVFDGEDGQTHLEHRSINLVVELAPEVRATPTTPSETVRFVEIEASSDESASFHSAPSRQLSVVLDGDFEIEAEAGERARCRPGTLLLLEDSGRGRGHRNITNGPIRVLFVEVPPSWSPL